MSDETGLDQFPEVPEEPVDAEEPVVSDEPVEEEKAPAGDTDYWRRKAQFESTRLGRKVKELSTKMVTKDDLNDFMDKLNNEFFSRGRGREEDEELPTDPHEMRRFVREEIARTNSSTRPTTQSSTTPDTGYEESYVDEFNELLWNIEDDSTRGEVEKLMTTRGSPYNKRLSNNPEADCGRNFARALADVVKAKRKTTKQNPFTARGASSPAGVTVPETQTHAQKKAPKLDDIAAEFAKQSGMSDEDIIASLEADISPGLKVKF